MDYSKYSLLDKTSPTFNFNDNTLGSGLGNSLFQGTSGTTSGTGALGDSAFLDYSKILGGDEGGGFFSNLLSNKNDMMGGLAGMLGAGVKLATLPSALRNAELSNEAARANLSAFREDRATHGRTAKNFDYANSNQTAIA